MRVENDLRVQVGRESLTLFLWRRPDGRFEGVGRIHCELAVRGTRGEVAEIVWKWEERAMWQMADLGLDGIRERCSICNRLGARHGTGPDANLKIKRVFGRVHR